MEITKTYDKIRLYSKNDVNVKIKRQYIFKNIEHEMPERYK